MHNVTCVWAYKCYGHCIWAYERIGAVYGHVNVMWHCICGIYYVVYTIQIQIIIIYIIHTVNEENVYIYTIHTSFDILCYMHTVNVENVYIHICMMHKSHVHTSLFSFSACGGREQYFYVDIDTREENILYFCCYCWVSYRLFDRPV